MSEQGNKPLMAGLGLPYHASIYMFYGYITMQLMCLHVNTCIPLSVECVFKCHSMALYVVRQCIHRYKLFICMFVYSNFWF